MPEIVINDYTYQTTPRYVAGHTVNEAEAEVLNGVLFKRVASAFGQKGRNAKKKGKDFDISQAAFDAYAEGFKLGEGRPASGRGQRDPVRTEGFRIIRDALAYAFRQEGAGRKVSSVTNEQLSAIYDSRPDIQQAAKDALARKQAVTAGGLGDLVPAAAQEATSSGETAADETPVVQPEVRGKRNNR